MLSNSTLGLIVGLALGLALAFGGAGAFLLVLAGGSLGLLVGKVLDGDIDLSGLSGDRTRRR